MELSNIKYIYISWKKSFMAKFVKPKEWEKLLRWKKGLLFWCLHLETPSRKRQPYRSLPGKKNYFQAAELKNSLSIWCKCIEFPWQHQQNNWGSQPEYNPITGTKRWWDISAISKIWISRRGKSNLKLYLSEYAKIRDL